jgi:hypothetical protein
MKPYQHIPTCSVDLRNSWQWWVYPLFLCLCFNRSMMIKHEIWGKFIPDKPTWARNRSRNRSSMGEPLCIKTSLTLLKIQHIWDSQIEMELDLFFVFFLSACGLISHSYLISAPFAWFKFQCWDCTPIIPSAHRPGYPSPLPSLPISKFERRRTRDLFDRIGLCSCQYLPVKKQDAALAPECSHETHGYAVTQNTFLQ